MKKLAILLACVAFFSCKPTKTITEYKEVVKIDTFKSEKVIERFRAIHDTLLIVNPCDSTGLLSDFYSKLVIPQGKIIIRSVDGNIQASINIDSMRTEIENKFKSSLGRVIEYRDKEVIKYRVPTWVVILLLVEFIALITWLSLKFGFNAIK
jgi:hypothetical protein